MLEHLNKYNIILASNSPRRRDLLQQMGLDFEVRVIPNLDESYPDDLEKLEIAAFLSIKKSEAYAIKNNELIITADTIVILDNQVLGKPQNEANAYEMLKKLSGKKHTVASGVCVRTIEQTISFTSTTEVYFDSLSDEEIKFYIENFKPFDKAGSYGIQEYIGYIGVKKINGSFFNVMGLPVHQLYQELKKIR